MRLTYFLPELDALVNTGLPVGRMNQTVNPFFVCDAIVRQWLKKVIAHSGYECCERCIQRGTHLESRIILLKTKSKRRTDHSFRNRLNAGHHTGSSPLEKLKVDMVALFPLDYMHLTCVGVCKRLLKRQVSSKSYSKKCHLTPENKARVEEILKSWEKYISSDTFLLLGFIFHAL